MKDDTILIVGGVVIAGLVVANMFKTKDGTGGAAAAGSAIGTAVGSGIGSAVGSAAGSAIGTTGSSFVESGIKATLIDPYKWSQQQYYIPVIDEAALFAAKLTGGVRWNDTPSTFHGLKLWGVGI
jgi:hypothetical protein